MAALRSSPEINLVLLDWLLVVIVVLVSFSPERSGGERSEPERSSGEKEYSINFSYWFGGPSREF